MEAFDNELFGPAASVMRAKDDAHAVELAKFAIWIRLWSIHGKYKRGEN
jgi:muconolactone delta-isomerase